MQLEGKDAIMRNIFLQKSGSKTPNFTELIFVDTDAYHFFTFSS